MINIAENGPNVSGVVTHFAKCRFLNVKSMSKLSSTTPSPPNLVSSIKLYREKWWKCDTRRRRQYLHKVSWPPAPGTGQLAPDPDSVKKVGENIRGDSWTSRHRQLETFSQDTEYVYFTTCLLSTLHCFLQLPPALEPQLIWLFMWSSKRRFSAVNQKPAAVSRIFSAWIKDPVQWAWEVVHHRETQIGKFAENLGQNMWLILILLSSKTGEIDCPAAGPRDTDGADDSRCRPVGDVWFLQTSKGTRKKKVWKKNLENFPHLLP